MSDEQMEQTPEQAAPKAYYGLDVYGLYSAHQFNFDEPTLTPTNIAETYRKHGFVPPSEQRKVTSLDSRRKVKP